MLLEFVVLVHLVSATTLSIENAPLMLSTIVRYIDVESRYLRIVLIRKRLPWAYSDCTPFLTEALALVLLVFLIILFL